MTRIYAYEREPYRTELTVDVLDAASDGGRRWVLLSDTLLFPEGGGQPADHGLLNGVQVLDVQRVDGEVRHYVDGPVEPGPAALHLDWARRFDHMQQHTAQHLLTAVALGRFGWPTTAFHLQPEVCDVELGTSPPSPAELAALEEAVAAEIRAGRPITARRVAPEEYSEMKADDEVRSRGLPAGHQGDVRLVEIAGIDLNTCGGTHLRSTAEIETVKLLGAEALRGGTRLSWIAGERVRRRLGEREVYAADLRQVFGAADHEIPDLARLKLDQLRDAGRRQRALEAQLADALVAGLVRSPDPVLSAHFPDADAGFLNQVARAFTVADHPGVALLTAERDGAAFFVLAAGAACQVDLPSAGRRVAELLDGRGGGTGRIFQGKAGALKHRRDAEDALRSLLA